MNRCVDSQLARRTSTTGVALTLNEVVIHYEVARGFQYTQQEREDLVAFLQAL